MVNRKYTASPFILIAVIFILLTSCTPSNIAPANSNARPQAPFDQTRAANDLPQANNANPQVAFDTPKPVNAKTMAAYASIQASNPTDTPTSTYTPTSTITPTGTQTPSPTPDVRVIDVNPQELSLKKADLPADAGYYLPGPNWTGAQLNSDIFNQMGTEKGKDYIERTGWTYGWWVNYERASTTVIAPQEVSDNVMLFTTYEGAIVHLHDYSTCVSNKGFNNIEISSRIGDASTSCISRELQPSGEYKVVILINFVYRNIVHQVGGFGWEREVRQDYLHQIAETLLTQLEAVPLSEKVTVKP
jgi:hypothetical protein